MITAPVESERVEFESDGLELVGTLTRPPRRAVGRPGPAMLVLHGFGTNREGTNSTVPARILAEWGYTTLRFDMRGCGESGGEAGRVLCEDQVRDTSNALTFLRTVDGVDPDAIGVIGSSFGGAVAVATAGRDERVAATISSGGWGNGALKFRRQHPSPEQWRRFLTMLDDGRRHRERTGESRWVDRYDIVPIPVGLRGKLPPGVHRTFPVETAQSMFDFDAEDVVDAIAPRPLLLLHAADDTVTPVEQSIRLFERAGQPAELHLLAGIDHFMFSESSPRSLDIIERWLTAYLPVHPEV